MKTTLYYFSATGNSLKLARDLAAQLGACQLVAIADALARGATTSASERVGLVFPVYAWGLPRMVEEFVGRLEAPAARYTFALASCVRIPGRTLQDLGDRLEARGLRLGAGYVVRGGRSSLMRLNALDRLMIRLERSRPPPPLPEERLDDILNDIRALRVRRPETSSWLASLIGGLLHGPALKTFKTMDSKFEVGDGCTGCGTCVEVCPRANVRLAGSRPVFAHDCELCHACIQWCPRFALRHPNFDPVPRQYRNAAVRLPDLVRSTRGDGGAATDRLVAGYSSTRQP